MVEKQIFFLRSNSKELAKQKSINFLLILEKASGISLFIDIKKTTQLILHSNKQVLFQGMQNLKEQWCHISIKY